MRHVHLIRRATFCVEKKFQDVSRDFSVNCHVTQPHSINGGAGAKNKNKKKSKKYKFYFFFFFFQLNRRASHTNANAIHDTALQRLNKVNRDFITNLQNNFFFQGFTTVILEIYMAWVVNAWAPPTSPMTITIFFVYRYWISDSTAQQDCINARRENVYNSRDFDTTVMALRRIN